MDDGVGLSGCIPRPRREDVQLEVSRGRITCIALVERVTPVEGRHLMARYRELSDDVSADES
jgi:hypothetical protein